MGRRHAGRVEEGRDMALINPDPLGEQSLCRCAYGIGTHGEEILFTTA
jgi:hypothetical protein